MPSAMFYTGPSLRTLHDEYAVRSRIDTDAPLVSASETIIEAPVERVWAAVADMRGWPAWAPGIRILELTEVAAGAPFRWRLGPTRIRSTFAVVEAGRELTWTGRVAWYKAVDRHVLEPAGPGRTRVIVEESLAGPLLPLLFSAAKLRANHQAWLAGLKRFVEGG
jgi:hypothetical protein